MLPKYFQEYYKLQPLITKIIVRCPLRFILYTIHDGFRMITCRGGIVSAANSITFAILISWCVLKTHWTKRFGSQLWLMNRATPPTRPASIQYSASAFLSSNFDNSAMSPERVCETKDIISWHFIKEVNTINYKTIHKDKLEHQKNKKLKVCLC